MPQTTELKTLVIGTGAEAPAGGDGIDVFSSLPMSESAI